ncbi:phosphotransferase [Brevibacillus ginsengisoli]|uniref:phosphotransferase n=1 Tax=Brevibacillus ginsengisoli TaxID=363854 RepID=UPI003CE9D3F9
MSEALIKTLELAYSCQIYGVKPKRNVYQVRSNRGVWIVKGYKDKEMAYWVTQLASILHEQGFFRTVHYVTTRDGMQVIPIGQRYYTVMKAIEGEEANYASLFDVKKAARSLAQFHQAAQGIPFTLEDDRGIPPIFDKWESRYNHFTQISSKINNRGPGNRFEQLISQLSKEIIRDSLDCLEQMRELPFNEELYQAYSRGTMAHRDVASHNFLITEKGNCYLIDLDTVHSDMQLVDLAQFMSRMMLMQGYQMNSFIDAIQEYTRIKHLSDSQIKMLITMLHFPDNVIREVTGIYAKRPGYRVRGVTQLLLLKRRFVSARKEFLQQANRTIHYWKKDMFEFGAS